MSLDPLTAGAPAITLTPPEQSDTYKLHTQLKFQFQINSLSATLYSGESTLVSEGRREMGCYKLKQKLCSK